MHAHLYFIAQRLFLLTLNILSTSQLFNLRLESLAFLRMIVVVDNEPQVPTERQVRTCFAESNAFLVSSNLSLSTLNSDGPRSGSRIRSSITNDRCVARETQGFSKAGRG